MDANPQCQFPTGYDGAAVLRRLAGVLDPELDESILGLGFVRSVKLSSGRLHIALRLPTSWCAVNFAFLMAEDVRGALLGLDGVYEVSVDLGEHCAAPQIEAAVNAGRPFAEAFPGEGASSLAALRLTFLRKGFLIRQQRLLHQLREAGCQPELMCRLCIADLARENDVIVVNPPDRAAIEAGPAATLEHYVERRAALGLDCGAAAPLLVGLDGAPIPAEQLQAHYEAARTMRVALEANGLFCRALMQRNQPAPLNKSDRGERHVSP